MSLDARLKAMKPVKAPRGFAARVAAAAELRARPWHARPFWTWAPAGQAAFAAALALGAAGLAGTATAAGAEALGRVDWLFTVCGALLSAAGSLKLPAAVLGAAALALCAAPVAAMTALPRARID